MSNEPDIVKELREQEKLGKLQSLSNTSLEYAPQNQEEIEEEKEVFSGGYQRINEELDLGELEKQYKTIFENYSVAITLADEKERIISWNRYAEELLNMNEKDLKEVAATGVDFISIGALTNAVKPLDISLKFK